jgi:hypothetical protein
VKDFCEELIAPSCRISLASIFWFVLGLNIGILSVELKRSHFFGYELMRWIGKKQSGIYKFSKYSFKGMGLQLLIATESKA